LNSFHESLYGRYAAVRLPIVIFSLLCNQQHL